MCSLLLGCQEFWGLSGERAKKCMYTYYPIIMISLSIDMSKIDKVDRYKIDRYQKNPEVIVRSPTRTYHHRIQGSF